MRIEIHSWGGRYGVLQGDQCDYVTTGHNAGAQIAISLFIIIIIIICRYYFITIIIIIITPIPPSLPFV